MGVSGYRIMWALCIFDLPVKTKAQRKAAHGFRMFLLDHGFRMTQYSCYMRLCAGGKEELDTVAKHVGLGVPAQGRVYMLWFTDKQFENVIRYHDRRKQTPQRNPDQLLLL